MKSPVFRPNWNCLSICKWLVIGLKCGKNAILKIYANKRYLVRDKLKAKEKNLKNAIFKICYISYGFLSIKVLFFGWHPVLQVKDVFIFKCRALFINSYYKNDTNEWHVLIQYWTLKIIIKKYLKKKWNCDKFANLFSNVKPTHVQAWVLQ